MELSCSQSSAKVRFVPTYEKANTAEQETSKFFIPTQHSCWFVRAIRSSLRATIRPLETATCPFVNLPEASADAGPEHTRHPAMNVDLAGLAAGSNAPDQIRGAGSLRVRGKSLIELALSLHTCERLRRRFAKSSLRPR